MINDLPTVQFLLNISRDGWGDPEGNGFKGYGEGGFDTPDVQARHSTRKAEIERIRDTDIQRYRSEKLDEEYVDIINKELKSGRGRGRAA